MNDNINTTEGDVVVGLLVGLAARRSVDNNNQTGLQTSDSGKFGHIEGFPKPFL
jgi:hypothetical protein